MNVFYEETVDKRIVSVLQKIRTYGENRSL